MTYPCPTAQQSDLIQDLPGSPIASSENLSVALTLLRRNPDPALASAEKSLRFRSQYEVHFQEFAGGHDYLSWRGTLSDGLLALMGTAAASSGQEPEAKPDSHAHIENAAGQENEPACDRIRN